jgi:hypothetical protein
MASNGSYQTYNQVGIAEDVSDIISNITPTKTPFQTSIGHEKIDSTLFEWQEDSLRDAASNAKAEGADATDTARVPTVMRQNRAQIMSETAKVSRTASRVKTYGRAREMAYQMEKVAKALKRDLEYAFVATKQVSVAGDDTTPTARKMAGVQAQIDSGNITYTGAGPAALDEAHLLTALQNAYVVGAEPSRIQVTPSNSVVVAGFAAAAGRYRTFQNGTGGDKSIVNVVNLYVSPFGEQKVEINRFLAAGDTLVYEPDQWAKCILDPWTRVPLAKLGDYDRQMIIGEFSLKHKNYKASSLIVEGTTGL